MPRSRPSTERGGALSRAVAIAGARLRDDRGSAALEFITVGVLLLVPLVYLVLALAQLQAAAFAVEGAARHATRVFVQAPSLPEADAAAERAIAVTLSDYGVDELPTAVAVSCRPDPADCLARRGFVTIEVAVEVPLPLVPPVIATSLPASIPMSAVATEQVSRFRSGS